MPQGGGACCLTQGSILFLYSPCCWKVLPYLVLKFIFLWGPSIILLAVLRTTHCPFLSASHSSSRIQSSFHVKRVLNKLHSFICSSEEMSFRTLYLSFGGWLVKISHKLWSLESTTQNNEQRKEWTKLLSMYWRLGKQLFWQWFYYYLLITYSHSENTHVISCKILWSPILLIPNLCSHVWSPGKWLYMNPY